jgi:hypothetical protein
MDRLAAEIGRATRGMLFSKKKGREGNARSPGRENNRLAYGELG